MFSVTLGRSDQHEYRLIRDLLAGYDKRVRPSRNYTESLNVTFGLALAQIIDVVSDVDYDNNYIDAIFQLYRVFELPLARLSRRQLTW